jgi:hypothetical protein
MLELIRVQKPLLCSKLPALEKVVVLSRVGHQTEPVEHLLTLLTILITVYTLALLRLPAISDLPMGGASREGGCVDDDQFVQAKTSLVQILNTASCRLSDMKNYITLSHPSLRA